MEPSHFERIITLFKRLDDPSQPGKVQLSFNILKKLDIKPRVRVRRKLAGCSQGASYELILIQAIVLSEVFVSESFLPLLIVQLVCYINISYHLLATVFRIPLDIDKKYTYFTK